MAVTTWRKKKCGEKRALSDPQLFTGKIGKPSHANKSGIMTLE